MKVLFFTFMFLFILAFKQDKLFTIYTNYYVFDINASDVCLSKFHLETSVKNKLEKKNKNKNLPHLELKKKKKLAPLGTENKKTFLARLEEKKTCPDPNFLLPP